MLASVKSKKQQLSQRKKLGASIRDRRRSLDLSQEQLAEKVDCHRNYVGNVERGEQNLTIDMLVRFARALGCTVSALVVESEL